MFEELFVVCGRGLGIVQKSAKSHTCVCISAYTSWHTSRHPHTAACSSTNYRYTTYIFTEWTTMSGHKVAVTVIAYSDVQGNCTVSMTINGFSMCLGLVCDQDVAAEPSRVERPVVRPPLNNATTTPAAGPFTSTLSHWTTVSGGGVAVTVSTCCSTLSLQVVVWFANKTFSQCVPVASARSWAVLAAKTATTTLLGCPRSKGDEL